MKNTRVINSITAEGAFALVEAAIAAGKRMGVPVSVAVCGPELGLIAFARSDGATPHSAETSRRKAQTAASTGKATGWMNPELAITLPLGTGNLLTNIPGGLPIRIDDAHVGGLGVAGGTVEQDAAIATEAIDAVIGTDKKH
jgi:uncharacterized protein GlcG (DUF336 family)